MRQDRESKAGHLVCAASALPLSYTTIYCTSGANAYYFIFSIKIFYV